MLYLIIFVSLRASLHLIFMRKIVVAEKKSMYKEINLSFIKTKK